MRKLRLGALERRTVALVGVNVLLLAILVLRALQGTAVDEILSIAPDKVVIEPLAVVTQLDAESLENLKAKALFHSTRSFYVPPPQPPVQQLPPQPDYRLVGAITAPQKPITAMLTHNQSRKSVKVRIGDDLDGWTVEIVEAKRVVAKLGEERFEITSTSVAARQAHSMSTAAPLASNTGFVVRPNVSRRARPTGELAQGKDRLPAPSTPAAGQGVVNTPPGVNVLSGKSAPEPSSASVPPSEANNTYRP